MTKGARRTEGADFLAFSGSRTIEVSFKDSTLYKTFGLGVEYSPAANLILAFTHGWRYMNFDSVERTIESDTAVANDPSEDNNTNLRGTYMDFRIGVQF